MPHIGELLVRQQDAFITPTLAGAWVAFNPAWSQPKHWRDAFGVVHLGGTVMGGAVPSTIFTLPAGYRPLLRSVVATVSNNALAVVDLQANGTVNASFGANASFSLDGITFRAEQ